MAVCNLKVSLVYRSSRTTEAKETLSQQNKEKKNKQRVNDRKKFILLVKQYYIISRHINIIDLIPKQLCNKQNIKGKQKLTSYTANTQICASKQLTFTYFESYLKVNHT